MNIINTLNIELTKIKNKIEELFINEFINNPENIDFYNEDTKIDMLNDTDLRNFIPSHLTEQYKDINSSSFGYMITLEHIPTGMLLEYIVFSTESYPCLIANKFQWVHRIVKIYVDNSIEDYLILDKNLTLFSYLNDIMYKTLMYQDFKNILENENEN